MFFYILLFLSVSTLTIHLQTRWIQSISFIQLLIFGQKCQAAEWLLCKKHLVYHPTFFTIPSFAWILTSLWFTPVSHNHADRVKSNPITGLDRPWQFQEAGAPRFQDNRHMKVVRLSALRTDRLYPPRKYSWYLFLFKAESTPGP
jgi:hypothetical protein